MSHKKTAIVFFSRSLTAEVKSKVWDSRFAVNTAIASSLIDSTKAVLSATGLDVIEVDESIQQGQSFGAKIKHAFEFGFNQGYDQLLLIGNDTVGLRASDLLAALDVVNERSQVFGPNKRGGLYLIGFERNHFSKISDQLISLPWSTGRLWNACKRQFAPASDFVLRKLRDLDTHLDIQNFVRVGKSLLALQLRAHVAVKPQRRRFQSISLKINSFSSVLLLRGPPTFAVK